MSRSAKKMLLSILVIAAFVGYTLVIRGQKSKTGQQVGVSSKSSAAASQTASSTPSASPINSSAPNKASRYKNGTFTGSVTDAYYGNIQVQAVVSGGKITDVQFLQYPNDNPNSQNINQQAMPLLKQEALQSQSASVDSITGATDTSQAFVQSLANALRQAQS